MKELDQLLAELSQVLAAQAEIGDSDEQARAGLEERRDRLRAVLRDLDPDEHRPTAELLEEHTRLEARLQAARKERVQKVPGKYLGSTQTVGGGLLPAEINRMIDEGNRFDELLERFHRLTEILQSRGEL